MISGDRNGAAGGEGGVQEADQGVDLGEVILGEVEDAPYIPLGERQIPLPQWEPIELGFLTIDLSLTKNTVFLWVAAVLVVATFLVVGRAYRRMGHNEAPSGLANMAEVLVVFFRDQIVRANIGRDGDRYTPFILTLFFFILYMNLLGLVPFGISATASLSVTAALAFLALISIEVAGFKALGPKGYAQTIFFAPPGMGPVGKAAMMLVMAPVEFMGKLTKPFALAIRLFANMTAGKILILALLGLILIFAGAPAAAWAGVTAGSVALVTAITLLKVFIAFLQAFIFAMLTAVFIGLIRHAH